MGAAFAGLSTARRGRDGAGEHSRAIRRGGSVAPPLSSAGALAQLLSPFPTVAYAQSPASLPPAAYAPAATVNANRLVAGRRAYMRLSANDYHDFIPDSRFETALERTAHNGRDSWRLITTLPVARRLQQAAQFPDMNAIVDTTWLDVATLRPLERRMHAGIMHATETYAAGQVERTIRMVIPPSMKAMPRDPRINGPFTSRFAVDTTRPLVVSEDGLRLLLRSLPLRAGWRGSIAIPVEQGGSLNSVASRPRTINLRVDGADTVQLFSGRYACWRVVIELGDTPAVWSVSQETGETLITNGPNGLAYPESRTYLMYGLEENRQLPSVRRR